MVFFPADSTNPESFTMPVAVLVDMCCGNGKSTTLLPGPSNTLASGPTVPCPLSLLDSLTVHAKMRYVWNLTIVSVWFHFKNHCWIVACLVLSRVHLLTDCLSPIQFDPQYCYKDHQTGTLSKYTCSCPSCRGNLQQVARLHGDWIAWNKGFYRSVKVFDIYFASGVCRSVCLITIEPHWDTQK